jgi:CubicO group peptidase (beta-lactamase class C family)
MRARFLGSAILAAAVACGDSNDPGTRLACAVAEPSAVGMDADTLAAADRRIRDDLPNENAFLVVRRGKLIAEHYYNGTGRSTVHPTRSVTKSAGGALTGVALRQGWIESVDQTLGALLPHYFDPSIPVGRRDIMIQDLLTMSSGLAYDSLASYPIAGSWVTAFLSGPSIGAPGSRFHYDSSNPHLLSAVISAHARRSLAAIAEETLFRPLGISTYTWPQDIEGYNVGSTDLSLTAQDQAKLGELYLRDGIWNGRRLLPEGWVAASTTPAFQFPLGNGYGYLWWTVGGMGTQVYAAAGYRQQWIVVVPAFEIVVVIASESISLRAPERDHLQLLSRYVLPAIVE